MSLGNNLYLPQVVWCTKLHSPYLDVLGMPIHNLSKQTAKSILPALLVFFLTPTSWLLLRFCKIFSFSSLSACLEEGYTEHFVFTKGQLNVEFSAMYTTYLKMIPLFFLPGHFTVFLNLHWCSTHFPEGMCSFLMRGSTTGKESPFAAALHVARAWCRSALM